tara:strand:+ start:12806 stop:14461 length:1656 start_codon:yes stop_codon:yes gene_type:complete
MSPNDHSSQLPALENNRFPELLNKITVLIENLKNNPNNASSPTENQKLSTIANQLNISAKVLRQPTIQIITDKIYTLTTNHRGLKSATDTQSYINTLVVQLNMLKQISDTHLETEEFLQTQKTAAQTHHIILGLGDKKLTQEIVGQLKYFNYTCTISDSLEEITSIIAKAKANTYSACLLDTDYCPNLDQDLVLPISESIPTLFISSDESAESRLFAVKAGGLAYLVRPIEFTTLIEKIDALTLQQSEGTPYRVLVIEDSNTQAKFIAQQLINAGMTTEVVTQPLKINDVLQEFQPELILMDLYMPKCSGFELTKMIRQQEPYTSIPIVYLSAEEDRNTQLHAITIGGDDFLTKPIDPEHLVAAIKARADRARTLRAEMIQDSLTGLLNHTRILEQLDLEIARAKRNHYALTFAMIDIDFFKTINDNHGHPIGDRVIKGLARLLKQGLRKTDSIGRYGGEEFAVILSQSNSETITPILEDIRTSFARLLHQGDDPLVEFTATVSIGAAEYNANNQTVGEVVQAADRALYKAKSEGRNCIRFDNGPGKPQEP